MSPLRKYLELYAEKSALEVSSALPFAPAEFSRVVVVPVREEGRGILSVLHSLSQAAEHENIRVLTILVCNATTPNASDYRVWEACVEHGEKLSCSVPAARFEFSPSVSGIALGFLFPGFLFSEKEGVGHARKIGMDLALSLYANGIVQSSWLSTTDGDARVSKDYFRALESEAPQFGLGHRIGARVHPYHHRVKQGSKSATALAIYEIYLRYYRLGLEFAGSPYAFPTIGSLLTLSAEAYASVRGFPKKNAAEDFYLLDKIAKGWRVALGGGEVSLRCRKSARVPFGTGQATRKIEGQLADGLTPPFPHPESFRVLRDSLASTLAFVRGTSTHSPPAALMELATSAIARSGDPEARVRHFHTAFDGLRTLQFLRAASRDLGGEMPWHAAIQGACFVKSTRGDSENPLTQLDVWRCFDRTGAVQLSANLL